MHAVRAMEAQMARAWVSTGTTGTPGAQSGYAAAAQLACAVQPWVRGSVAFA